MSTVAATDPHTVRASIAKAAAGAALLTIAATGVWHGTHAIGQHLTQPDTSTSVSYADQSTIDATVRRSWHTPATAGDFITTASIGTSDVVSAVQVVR